jgi:1-pyrroline-5-carboxylate dehydrogenase
MIGDDSKGYFIQPTVLLSKDPKSVTFVEEIFGPVLSVSAVVLLTRHS